jgi:uncharacterized repeat protein (TIGR01451 family)
MHYISPASAALTPASAVTETVKPTSYAPGGLIAGPYVPLAYPTLNGVVTPLPASLLLAPMNDTTGKSIAWYARNEAIFVRVVSFDANVNPNVADQVSVTLTTTSGDSEVLQLTETGPSTGVFLGVVPSVFAAIGSATTQNDGRITISTHEETITAVYNHANCAGGATIASSSSALIDPYGMVFDSKSGAPVNGVALSLINTLTGSPAIVYCDDGVTIMPQPVVTGQPTICDAIMPAGSFHFPQVEPGNYKIVLTPVIGYAFPSIIPAASLPALIGTGATAIPPVILGMPGINPGGSYGGVFTLYGLAVKVDIPFDPASASLSIQKTAGKAVAGTGEFVPYTLTVTNNSPTAPVNGATIADHMPQGFRYQKGSARLDAAVLPDPHISADGRTLTFTLNLAPAATATLNYVLEVTPAAHTGTAENTAAATGGISSNTARASVLVREDLYRNKAILIGRVIDGSCDDRVDNDLKGLANARIVLQDGSYILTDKEGRWHMDNLRPGTHVVQLDLDSLPKDYEVMDCEKNDRFAGSRYSQFVNLRGGTLWRADFHVQKIVPVALRVTQTLSAQQQAETTTLMINLVSDSEVTGYSTTVMLPQGAKFRPGSARLNGESIPDPDMTDNLLIFRNKARQAIWRDQYTLKLENVAADANLTAMARYTPPGRAAQNLPPTSITPGNSATTYSEVKALAPKPVVVEPEKNQQQLIEVLPYDAAWLASTQPGTDWLHPQEKFNPAIPAIKAAVKHLPGQTVKLILNGEPVSALYYDGTLNNAQNTVSLSTWSGIHIKDLDNKLELVVSDATGHEVLHQTRNIHYAVSPDRVEFIPELSHLVADGKTRPVIAVRFVDKGNYPLRRGLTGEFRLNEPYRSFDSRKGIDNEPLTGKLDAKSRFEIGRDGVAQMELEPTTQSGEAILNFQFNDQRVHEVRAWLEAGKRDWILVGFGEGTLGQKKLSGNMQAVPSTELDRELFDGNKLAFYAKGSIRGDYLLTAAYDTTKDTGNKQLKQAVDPAKYYTLYADAAKTGFDAASSTRLYVKLERKQFYAMFGDYDTGLSVTELSRYSRTLNGLKSEYKGKNMGYNAFVSVTAQAYVKDEIPGNGTSGIYKLSRGNLVMNSDKIRIETRDRFHSENVVTTLNLTRYLDYDLDAALGTVTFREPIATHDSNFNPTYIVVEYESADPADKKATFGGRASYKPIAQVELGTTLIHEGTVGATGNLLGVDATYKPDEKTRIRTEAATSNGDHAGILSKGNAWLVEATHQEALWDGKAYFRKQDAGFGMGQQSTSLIGTRKAGVEAGYKLSDTLKLHGQAFRDQNLSTDASNTVVEVRADQKVSSDFSVNAGLRSAEDKSAAATLQSRQFTAGAMYTLLDKKLALHGSTDISSGTAGSATMPNRVLLGADYKLTDKTKLFVEEELARGQTIASNTTRAGLRTQPWEGGEVSASVGDSINNDAERLYGNLGLVQRWKINDKWATDFSLDRSQTLRNTATPLNPNTPLPSGTFPASTTPSGTTPAITGVSGDYTAMAVGLAYHEAMWSANGRLELRNASDSKQQNLLLGMQHNLDAGSTLSAGLTLRNSVSGGNITNNNDIRLSYAHRPNDGKWVWFDRADYITQTTSGVTGTLNSAKLVNNLNANYMPNRHTQISFQYGSKYVLDTIESTNYKGYTDLIGTEMRYDLTHKWDVGVFASVMNSWNSGIHDFGYGASLGYNLMKNTQVVLGYNVRGMNDRDFADASYRARGIFLTLRVKLDQDSFDFMKSNPVALIPAS